MREVINTRYIDMVKKTKDDYDIGTSYITANLKYYVTRLTDMVGY